MLAAVAAEHATQLEPRGEGGRFQVLADERVGDDGNARYRCDIGGPVDDLAVAGVDFDAATREPVPLSVYERLSPQNGMVMTVVTKSYSAASLVTLPNLDFSLIYSLADSVPP
jgi:hypothetical protein